MTPQHATLQSLSTCYKRSHDLSTVHYLQHHYPLPHRYMLESNESPYYPESIHLRKTYENAKKVKKRLEDDIARLKERVIPRLEMELAHVATVVVEHALVLAPMRVIPTEVLLRIMSFYLGPDNQIDLLNLTTSAWRLAHVCQRWRSIVLGTPSFWSNITIDLRDQERFLEPQHQGIPQILSTHLRRSNVLPLTITFKSNSGVTDLVKRILDILIQYRGRWRNVVLDVPPELIPSWCGDGTPCLESVSINISFLRVPGRRLTLFSTAPLLKTVTLFGASAFRHREGLLHHFFTLPLLPGGGVVLGPGGLVTGPNQGGFAVIPEARDISPKLPLPWKQLSTLDIEFGAWGDFLPVLKQTPNVLDCRLRSYVFTRSMSHTVIALPKLQSLELLGTAVMCLQYLSARSLKSLIIGDAAKSPHCGQDVIFQFLSASSCKLQHLSFQSIPMSDHTLDVLRAAPSLSSLSLCLETNTGSTANFDALLSALTYISPGHEYPLSKLGKLSLSIYHKDAFPHKKLVEMVKSRRRVPVDEENAGRYVRLEEFRLYANTGWVSDFDELKEDEGLQTEFALR
ncbi:hypothetical protein E1B28_010849 [Marasmius oreades]|uniref:F-box domain-containing protein n=1 Tax=Marasmius oreades TaxID=181124 RepID=A0A9P7RST6_9AGAR|nr:uncharacterized protein E1B28_010849 [Marasmius oreades]KAG7089141.1 hypothetical protein E1B28_010849 [Marasmius oreades]